MFVKIIDPLDSNVSCRENLHEKLFNERKSFCQFSLKIRLQSLDKKLHNYYSIVTDKLIG